jgi:hypothetical protein
MSLQYYRRTRANLVWRQLARLAHPAANYEELGNALGTERSQTPAIRFVNIAHMRSLVSINVILPKLASRHRRQSPVDASKPSRPGCERSAQMIGTTGVSFRSESSYRQFAEHHTQGTWPAMQADYQRVCPIECDLLARAREPVVPVPRNPRCLPGPSSEVLATPRLIWVRVILCPLE